MPRILLEPNEAEIEIKKSRFLAKILPVAEPQEIKKLVQNLRLEHPRSRHICYAYILRNGITGSNDDGEPHGTAGRPLLEVLAHSGVVDICVLVVRYFGGTLLGKGGLARAYKDSAKEAMLSLETKELNEVEQTCYLTYAQFEKFKRNLEQHGTSYKAEFCDNVKVTWATNLSAQIFLQHILEEITR